MACGAPSTLIDRPHRQRVWNGNLMELEAREISGVGQLCLRVQAPGQPWQSLRCVTARHRTLATWDDAGRAWLYSGDVGIYWYEADTLGAWRESTWLDAAPPGQPPLPPDLAAEVSYLH